jgi:hypothetical protein
LAEVDFVGILVIYIVKGTVVAAEIFAVVIYIAAFMDSMLVSHNFNKKVYLKVGCVHHNIYYYYFDKDYHLEYFIENNFFDYLYYSFMVLSYSLAVKVYTLFEYLVA